MTKAPSAMAWMVTYLDSPEAVELWRTNMMHNARVSSKIDLLATRMRGWITSLDLMCERDKAALGTVRSDYLKGQLNGELLMTELAKEWMEKDLKDLLEIQKDLLAVLGR